MQILTKYFTDFTEKQLSQFDSLKNLYKEWNEKINVISRKDMDSFYEHHVLHSLAIATQFDFPEGYKILDLGTGGGFPGIPLAIFFPNVHFHLVDSINKKIKVAQDICQQTHITNVSFAHSRAEDLPPAQFDMVVSRAVASISQLWQWSKPLLKKKPIDEPKKLSGLVCLKGGDLAKEIAASQLRPQIWEIDKIFPEPFFAEKYILYCRQ
ncbi:MAG: 16S rRNA (guanine(527)-N(7))-methyltransferase RsmG [Ginsengibacter sp.]